MTIAVQCQCGKRSRAKDDQAGKRVKCPDCGRAVIVPTMSSPQSVAVASQTEDPPKSTSKARYIVAAVGGLITLQGCIFKLIEPSLFATIAMVVGMVVVVAGLHVEIQAAIRQALSNLIACFKRASTIAIWSFGGVLALGCVLYSHWLDQAPITAANEAKAIVERAEQAKQQRIRDDANSKVAMLFGEATEALKTGDIETGRQKIEKALAVPHANAVANARNLYEQIQNATDPTRIHNALYEISDETFQQLKQDGTMPPQMIGKFMALNLRAKELVKADIERVAEARESRRKQIAWESKSRRLAELQELNFDGLVLLQDTVWHSRNSGEITGVVENRRGKKLRYAKITFNLYDASGSQVGNALAVVEGLESGDKWRFKALSFVTDFSTYKVSELTGN